MKLISYERDNGIRTMKEFIEKKYEPFQLRLGIIKKMVDLHGGEIKWDSKIREGTYLGFH